MVFYQMLTGELPGQKIEPPSKKIHVDVRLDEIVLRALEQKPELRYQQVSDVKTMVETIASTPPPATPPATPVGTAGVPVREKPDLISELLLLSPIIGARNGRRVIHWAGWRANGILFMGVMTVVFVPAHLSGEHISGWLVSLFLFVLGMIVTGAVRDCRRPIEQLPCLDNKAIGKNPQAYSVFGSLYLALVVGLMVSASWLPDRVACHFGLDGTADDWMGRVPYLLLIAALPAVMALLFAFVSRRIRTAGASFVNIPRRDYWLAPERRATTVALIRDRLTWLLCLLTLFFGSLHVLTIAANRTSPPHLNMGALLVVVIVLLFALMMGLFMLVMRFAEAADGCGGTAPPQLPSLGRDGSANSQSLEKSKPPRFSRMAIVGVVALLVLVGVVLIARLIHDFGGVPAFERMTKADIESSVRRSAIPVGATITRAAGTVLVVHDKVDVHYVFFAPKAVGTSDSSSYNTHSLVWMDNGTFKLTEQRTFGYLRESVNPFFLKVNGMEYDLRQGRVFLPHEDGTLEQLKMFPSLATARDPVTMAVLIPRAQAMNEEPITEEKLNQQIEATDEQINDLKKTHSPTHPLVIAVQKAEDVLREKIRQMKRSDTIPVEVTFGPVSERVLPFDRGCIDFQSGNMMAAPSPSEFKSWRDGSNGFKQGGTTNAAVPGANASDTPRQVVAEWLRRIQATTTNHAVAAIDAIWELTTRGDDAAWSPGMESAYHRVRLAHQLGNAERTMVLSATIKNQGGEDRVFYANLLKRDGQWLINDHGFRSPAEVRERVEGFRASPGVKFDVRAAELAGDWSGLCLPDLTLAADGTGVEMLNKDEPKPQALRWEVRGATLRKHRPDREETWEITWIDDHTFAVHNSDSGLLYERKEANRPALTSATNAKPAPAAATPAFGPVMEREICFSSVTNGPDRFLDLDTGRFVTPPPAVERHFAAEAWIGSYYATRDKATSREMQSWVSTSGVDLLVDGWQKRLTMLGGWGVEQGAHQSVLVEFERADPVKAYRRLSELDDAFRQSRNSATRLSFLHPPGWYSASREAGRGGEPEQPHDTVLFRTAAGSMGLLQFVGFTDHPGGAKVRYKLLQNSPAIAAAPATNTTAAFGPVIKYDFGFEQSFSTCWALQLASGKVMHVDLTGPLPDASNKLATAVMDLLAYPESIDRRMPSLRAAHVDLMQHPCANIPDMHLDHGILARTPPQFTFDAITVGSLNQHQAKPGTLPYVMLPKAEVKDHPVLLFETREGGRGVLQITGFSPDSGIVKLRYKLVPTTEQARKTDS